MYAEFAEIVLEASRGLSEEDWETWVPKVDGLMERAMQRGPIVLTKAFPIDEDLARAIWHFIESVSIERYGMTEGVTFEEVAVQEGWMTEEEAGWTDNES